MTTRLELDCLGTKCPRPIIEIAKASRRLPGGAELCVKADDLAFESDVRAWVDHAGAEILAMEKEGRKITVTIKLAE